MASLNKVTLIGNLTRDVETRVTQGGMTIGRTGIACNDRVKQGSEWVDKPMFIDCTLFGKTAENAAQYLSKGSTVCFDGRLELQQWEKDGVKHSKHCVIVDRMVMVGSKGGSGGGGGSSKGYNVPKREEVADSYDSDVPF